MELKQLESFTHVVEYRSFTKAAEKLYISQPTISTHIRQLEEEPHSRLIIRTTKSIEITPRGWELYECACHILRLRDNLLQRWEGESRKIIRLGASTIPSAYILPELLPAYGKAHPDTYFSIHQATARASWTDCCRAILTWDWWGCAARTRPWPASPSIRTGWC